MAVVSTSLSAGPVFNPNYDAIVDIRSLRGTEGFLKRVTNWRIFLGKQRIMIRLGADNIKKEREDRDISGSDRGLFVHTEI